MSKFTFKIGDKIGPEYIIKVYNPKFKVWGYLVIDNTNLGPGKGGIRMTSTVNEVEVWRLARAMTLKNSLAGIAFGGAKAGIVFDPHKNNLKAKKEIIQWFARALKPVLVKNYIAGPDINTGEREMKWFVGAARNKKAATGKPKLLGGLPHELGSTGFGVAHATKVALEHKGINIHGATVAIEGFGNVGIFAFKFLSEMGAKIIAVSDSKGTVSDEKGLDYKKIIKIKKEKGSVVYYKGGYHFNNEKIFSLKVDVLIPAAGPDVINENNFNNVRAKIIVGGSNIPMQEVYEDKFYTKGILVVPDIIANAGGVISSYAEYRGYNTKKMFNMVQHKITKSVKYILTTSQKVSKKPRDVAMQVAVKKLFFKN